jgi:hypothetical protein
MANTSIIAIQTALMIRDQSTARRLATSRDALHEYLGQLDNRLKE